MIIQHVAKLFISKDKDDRCVSNTAIALDWIVAVALLIIGILGATGAINMVPALTYSFLGAGCVYTVVMIISASVDIKVNCSG